MTERSLSEGRELLDLGSVAAQREIRVVDAGAELLDDLVDFDRVVAKA